MDRAFPPDAVEGPAGSDEDLRQDWLRLLGVPAPVVFRGSFLRYALSFEVERALLLSRTRACPKWAATLPPEGRP